MKLTIWSEVFTRGVADIITLKDLEGLLSHSSKLRVKHGIDATSPFLHIGHAANLWKLRSMQEAGHKAVILLGDLTTQIGDPTGKSKTRPVLSPREIENNIKSIKSQVEQILLTDSTVYEFRRNSEWFGEMKSLEFLKLVAQITHARLIERDMFQERIKKGEEINVAEMLYPILQGYDSVMLKSDATIIGSDQVFNEHMGRMLQERFGQKPQVIIALQIVPGLDGGEKMSKSTGNYIGLLDTPQDKFGKAMRLLDNLIIPYLEVYTDVSREDIKKTEQKLAKGLNPKEAKMFFAEKLVERYHGREVARQERERFVEVFSKKELPKDITALHLKTGSRETVELLLETGMISSKSEARRLLKQKAVEVDNLVLSEDDKIINIKKGTVVKIGKRKFIKID